MGDTEPGTTLLTAGAASSNPPMTAHIERPRAAEECWLWAYTVRDIAPGDRCLGGSSYATRQLRVVLGATSPRRMPWRRPRAICGSPSVRDDSHPMR